MGLLDPWDWLVILAVALLVFGPKRLPEIARTLGKGIREFKDAFKGSFTDEGKIKAIATDPPPAQSEPPKL